MDTEEPVETIDVEDLKRIEREERNKRILEWITKHSKPKVLINPKIVRHPTRFQKPGPMTANNWSTWRKWVKRNSIAKSKRKQKKPPPPPPPEKGDWKQGEKAKTVNKNRMNEMAMPKEVRKREKYEPPPPEEFTFMPKIIGFDPAKQKPRKIPLHYNPFEIRKGALTYRATQTIIKLAKPRKPTGPSYLVSRKKFTNKQWKIYQKYLQILSFPKLRIPPIMGDCVDPSIKSKQKPVENQSDDTISTDSEPKKSKWWQCCNRNENEDDHCSLSDLDERKRKRGPNKKRISRLALPKKCPALFDKMRCLKPKIKNYLHKDDGQLYKQEMINLKRLEARAERIKYHLIPEIDEDKKYKAKLEKLDKYKKKDADDADDEDEGEKKEKKLEIKRREKARAQPKKCPKEFDKNLCLKPKQKDYLKKGTNIRGLTLAQLLEIKAKREAKEKKGGRSKKIDVFFPEKRIPKSLNREPPTGTPAIERRKECIINIKPKYMKHKDGPQYKISKPIRMCPDMEKIKRKNLAAWKAEKNPKFYDEKGKERPPTAAERKKISQALRAKPKRCPPPIDIDGLGCIPPLRKDFLKKGQYTKRTPPAPSVSSIETLGTTEISFHGRIRRRHHPRGTKRGRPRGSGRGGKTNTPGRDGTPGTPTGGSITLQVQSTPATPTGDSNTSANGGGGSEQSFETIIPLIKRGPGRPRLKAPGPPNPGYRGAPRTRKPIGPLVVPLGQSPGATPLTRSPAMSPAPSPAHGGIGYYQPNDDEFN